jgi:hypothetical protein
LQYLLLQCTIIHSPVISRLAVYEPKPSYISPSERIIMRDVCRQLQSHIFKAAMRLDIADFEQSAEHFCTHEKSKDNGRFF